MNLRKGTTIRCVGCEVSNIQVGMRYYHLPGVAVSESGDQSNNDVLSYATRIAQQHGLVDSPLFGDDE